jgi:hypothetical protein
MGAGPFILLVAVLLQAAEPLRTWQAPEARQGVAVDAAHFYAVSNSAIARHDRATGRREVVWRGDPRRFPHINSCAVVRAELVCAASNYPKTPMQSRVEVFDPVRMQHLRTIDLGGQGGSLTFVEWRDGVWWAGFANYDGRGGEPGRDHRATKLMTFDTQWRPLATWTLPVAVLDRLKPYGVSGGAFGAGGLLYVTGHDRPELYALKAPPGGGVLTFVATVETPMNGQAIAIDPKDDCLMFGIRRRSRQVVAMRLPAVQPGAR